MPAYAKLAHRFHHQIILFLAAFVSTCVSLSAVGFLGGVEKAISLSYLFFDGQPSSHPLTPDLGSIPDSVVFEPIGWRSEDTWKLSAIWGDSAYYRAATLGEWSEVISPYRYRIVPLALSRLFFLFFTNGNATLAWVLLNIVSVALTAVIIAHLSIRALNATTSLAIAVPALMTATPPIMHTVGFIAVDPFTVLCTSLVAYAFWKRSNIWFAFGAIIGVLTKEVLAVFGFAWLLITLISFVRERSVPLLIKGIFVSSLPFVTFIIVRVVLGAPPLEVNYGYDLANGELPSYYERFFSVSETAHFLVSIILSFTFFWSGFLGAMKVPWLRLLTVVLTVALIASIALFSSRALRGMAPLAPLLALGIVPIAQTLDKRNKSNVDL